MSNGEVKTVKKALLAPLAGVADRAFREICTKFGAAACTGEMVSVKGINYGDAKSHELLMLSDIERPAGIQLFGNTPDDFEKAVYTALKYNPDFIDINMGCPAPKVTKNGSGSALMRDPELCGKIVAATVKNSDVPVTVKIRKGWNAELVNAVEVAKICEQAGAAAVTVHGRTREQMYAPYADLDIIKQVKNSVSVPVIGNGDITDGKSCKKMLEYTLCDAVAVGRGALGRPWIFSEINAFLGNYEFTEPTVEEKMDIMMEHISMICSYKGKKTGINESRKHALWYTKGIRNGAEYRRKLSSVSSVEELYNLSRDIIKNSRS